MSRKSLKLTLSFILLAVISTASYFSYTKFFYKADEVINNETTIILPVNNERFVYTDTPLIQGKASANSLIKIFSDNQEIGETTTDADGNFYYKPDAFTTGVHTIKASNISSQKESNPIRISIDVSNPSKAILKTNSTQIFENDHPFYANGANQYDAIVKIMGDPTQVEADFAKAEKMGIKTLRVINYTLDDMRLPDPAEAPTLAVANDGGLLPGSYVYRYTCANLSKKSFAYDTAETLPSPASASVTVANSQKVNLTLKPCAKSYRYLVYRRNAADPVGSETYLGFAEGVAGQNVTFVDDGSYRPAGVWPNPTDPPQLQTQARNTAATTTLEAGDYIYRYAYKEQRKPVDGRGEKFVAGSSGTNLTTGSQTARITVSSGEAVKISIPAQNSPWSAIFRRKATDPVGSEKYIAMPQNVNGTISFIDEGVQATTPTIPTTNNTVSIGVPTANETRDNPRSHWPTSQSKAFMTGFGNWNEDALIAADKTMALAKKYNIRIMFTFLDQHDNNTGGFREVARNCATSDISFFANQCAKDTNKEIISKFLERTNSVTGLKYKNDPAIFAWEFINEPYATGHGNTFRAWISEMGNYLKSKDPNHMLASGDDGSIWFTHNYEGAYNAGNNHDFVMMGTPASIDLLTWHGYPESSGFMFNHSHYGEFKPDPVADAEWLAKYGPVKGPIDINGAIKQLELHAHYAELLNKPVIFGEWGLDWSKPTASDWIRRLSQAILESKPDLVKGKDIFPDGSFSQSIGENWLPSTKTAKVEIDAQKPHKNHPTLKVTPSYYLDSTQTKQYYRQITTKKFPISPNTKYWYDYTIDNPTTKSLGLTINYYKNGQKLGVSTGITMYQTNGWQTFTRFNTSACEFTSPDANEAELVVYSNTTETESIWIGEINLRELTSPTSDDNSTFSGTGWWALPDPNSTGLGNLANSEALRTAAINFANKSVSQLPALAVPDNPPVDDPVDDDPADIPTPPVVSLINTSTYSDQYILTGSLSQEISLVIVNSQEATINQIDKTWSITLPLALGQNNIEVRGIDPSGKSSSPTNFTISRNKLGDINGDNTINKKDFSILMTNWGTPKLFLSDLNSDKAVNKKDFSILMMRWGR